jgi:hypothetical protein
VSRLVVLGAVAALCACGTFYKPVPVANAIGEQKTVLAGDTVRVYREERFEVYGPAPDAVYDGYEQLNRAVRMFERHFTVRAPRVAVVMARDTSIQVDSGSARDIRSRGFSLVSYVRPHWMRSRQSHRSLDYGGVLWPIAPTASRAMLARYAESRGGQPARHDSAVLDRLPVWYRAAVMHLVGDAGNFGNDVELLRDNRSKWQPLRTVLTLVRAASADSLLDPSRRNEADEFTRIVAAQASTFGRYLVEREGPAVIGRIGAGYLAGRSLNEMFGEFRSAPKTLDELESRWKIWIETPEN